MCNFWQRSNFRWYCPNRHLKVVRLSFLTSFICSLAGISNTSKDAAERESIFGRNEIPTTPPPSFLQLVWHAMQDTTLIILQVAALVSLLLSFYHEPHGE